MEEAGSIATIAFCVAVCLFVAEIFIPSGGLLGVGSVMCMVYGVVCLFEIGPVYGWVGVFGSLLSLPLGLWVAVKVFPHTLVGKWLTIGAVDKAAAAKASAYGGESCDDLMGKTGEVVTELRPVGMVEFGGVARGRRVECLAVMGVIETGAKVKVTGVEGMAVKVEAVREG